MTLRAAAARTDITPPVGVDLTGYAAREQPSIGVLDPLYAYSLYLEQGQERLLWIHTDLLGLARDHVQRLRKRICERLGLAERQVLMSATHTHAGPATFLLRGLGEPDASYLAELDERLVTVAEMAAEAPLPATLRFAQGSCDLARDRRRPSALSHVDHRLPVWVVCYEDGLPIAIVANYAMHNVSLSGGNRLISADVAGHAAYLVRQQVAGAPFVLVTNGACGNVNPPELAGTPERMWEYGERLATAIVSTVQEAEPIEHVELATALTTQTLPLSVLSAEEVQAEHARLTGPGAPTDERWLRPLDQWRDETLAAIASGAPDSISTDVQVIRLGHATLVALGAEVFSHMTDDLAVALGPHTFVVGFSNGDLGYMPPRAIYAEGGYEVDLAYMYYGHFMVAPGAFELVRERAISLARSLGVDYQAQP